MPGEYSGAAIDQLHPTDIGRIVTAVRGEGITLETVVGVLEGYLVAASWSVDDSVRIAGKDFTGCTLSWRA